MKARPAQPANRGGCCRRLAWTRYRFEKNVTAAMPMLQAASHKVAERRVNFRVVLRWIERRKAERAARRLRVQTHRVEGGPRAKTRFVTLSLPQPKRLCPHRLKPLEHR